MAHQIQALKDQEQLVKRTLDSIASLSATEQPIAYVLDTGGIIDLFKHHPAIIPNTLIGAQCITTNAVFNELHLRKNYKIINQIYYLDGMKDLVTPHIEVVGITPTRRNEDVFRYGLKRGSFDGNRRLGEADLSILALADDWKDHMYPVIISPDSDIPRVLNGIRTKRIGYLPSQQFAKVYEAQYTLTPRGVR